ncbi:MAG: hypothetical protein GF392_06015 [Candidatus Omnitrophica bacterium]|nr:hypothetical protein [Candidatus Omnitrophota bacterium]
MVEKRECGVEVFSRVTGFFRPVQSWNNGKSAEFKNRKRYKVPAEKVAGDLAEQKAL